MLFRSIGSALGFENITSPTFVISKIYKGTPNLIHVDAYRLQGEAHALFDDLDLESYLPNSVCVIEWGEGLISRIAEEYLEIRRLVIEKFGSIEQSQMVIFDLQEYLFDY